MRAQVKISYYMLTWLPSIKRFIIIIIIITINKVCKIQELARHYKNTKINLCGKT